MDHTDGWWISYSNQVAANISHGEVDKTSKKIQKMVFSKQTSARQRLLRGCRRANQRVDHDEQEPIEMNRVMVLSLVTSMCCVSVSAIAWAAEPFKKTLELQGFSFVVEATNEGSINQLKIIPSGLTKDNTPVESEIEGTVSGAEIGDLDANGFPEVYVYVTSAGSGSYGSLMAYAVNNGKSMTPIYLPPITDDAKASKGYMGHDEFAVLENVLGRRFPIYKEGDMNSDPSGKTRQLQYKLVPGEAGWILRLKDITEF